MSKATIAAIREQKTSPLAEPQSGRGLTKFTEHDAGFLGARRLLEAEQVASLLSVPKSWVYAETRAGRLPHVKIGRYYRYAPDSIAAFIAGLERGPVPYRKYGEPPRKEPGGGGDG